jgi:2-octaprenylphenol hydroxylase
MQKFDVIIVGAGMVGLTLALSLRQQGNVKVALVDTLTISPITDEPEVRVSAINMASKNIFENLSVWQKIKDTRTLPYEAMHVWDKSGIGKLDFSVADMSTSPHAKEVDECCLGWIVENKVIRNALYEKASEDSGITFFTQQRLSNLTMGDSEVFASFAEPTDAYPTKQVPILSKLVIGADGANSWVRNQMDIGMTFRDYDHHAIVTTIKCSQGHQNTAWQVFLPTGPLAFLPLYNKGDVQATCSIVYSTSPDEAKRLTSLSKEDFSKALTAASDGKLGTIEVISERFTYPLTMRLAQDFVKERVILIGDAAHTIHPLAGQGVNLGLLDAAALSQTLLKQLCAEPNVQGSSSTKVFDIANPTALNDFARWRKSEASDMIVAMEAIKQAFSVSNSPVGIIRGVGMNLLNQFKPAKKLLISQALGLKADLPTLALKQMTHK